jgi:ferritin-like metal-binding protein YciE
MGLLSKDFHTLDDLFVHTLRDIYYAENRIVKALPDMIEKAFEPQLIQAFKSHLGETEKHISRLQEVFRMYDVEVKGVDCPAIDGILEEVDDLVDEIDDRTVLDAALIAAAQLVEHYEIARYDSLIAWAKELGRSDCASVLDKNLEEEKATSRKLTLIADARVNIAAATN